jgi:hypothetical protein
MLSLTYTISFLIIVLEVLIVISLLLMYACLCSGPLSNYDIEQVMYRSLWLESEVRIHSSGL